MIPKMALELLKKLINSGCVFSLFIKVLEFFRCLLGIVLALLRLSWTAWDPKTLKEHMVLGFLQMHVFGILNLIMDLSGASWPLLG